MQELLRAPARSVTSQPDTGAAAQQARLEALAGLASREPLRADVQANLGRALSGLGRHQEALECYDRALRMAPDAPDVLYARASALASLGEHVQAAASYERALALAGPRPEVLNNYGLCLAALGRQDAALACYQRALALRPDYARALNNRGLTLAALRRHNEAAASYRAALALQPDYFQALTNLAETLRNLREYPQALACCADALGLRPAAPEPLLTRARIERDTDGIAAARESFGQVLHAASSVPHRVLRASALAEMGRHEEALACLESLAGPPDCAGWLGRAQAHLALRREPQAIECIDRALAINPELGAALQLRAIALESLGEHVQALSHFDRAVRLLPHSPEVYCNRGITLQSLARFTEALADYDSALRLEAGFPEALNNRGSLLYRMGREEFAVGDFERALALRPDYLKAMQNVAMALHWQERYTDSAAMYSRAIAVAESATPPPVELCELRAAELHARASGCNWDGFAERLATVAADVMNGACVRPWMLFGLIGDGRALRRCAETYSRTLFAASTEPLWRGELYRHDRIRVAYVCGELRDHPTAHLLAGLFERHDRSRFEITAVSLSADRRQSAMRKRLESCFDHFLDMQNVAPREIAAKLREMEIDILVDLNGHSGQGQPAIYSHRPAPVQVSYLAYPGTTGAPYMDYFLADRTVVPEPNRAHFSEAVVYLPGSYQVNDYRSVTVGEAPGRAQLGLPDAAFVFCSFNNNYKIVPELFAVWMRLLDRVPGSVLWLLVRGMAAAAALRSAAASHGIDPQRLVFAELRPLEEHLARHGAADLFLDTLPCCAHTTASDALWAGLPIVTCLGESFAGRVCASLLQSAGVGELVTESLADYEALALRLATHPQELAHIRQRLTGQARASALFDTDRKRRDIEGAYVIMWERTQQGTAAASFEVTAGG